VEFVPTIAYSNDLPNSYRYSYQVQNNIYCQENNCLNNGTCFISLMNTPVCLCPVLFTGTLNTHRNNIFIHTIK
jgi:hypothetical protein